MTRLDFSRRARPPLMGTAAHPQPPSTAVDAPSIAGSGQSPKSMTGEGQCLGVRDGHEAAAHLHACRAPGGAAVQLQLRWSAEPHDLDVLPQDAAGMAGAESLHRRFFRRKTAGEMRTGRGAAA